ncbi:MAG: D-glycero-beta-D-manno-heptose 1,7-bisphosphate 7-phosphatase [Planctomycetota bacterium]
MRAVFLDRDGTLNVEVDYLSDPDQLELLPGVPAALRRLTDAGFKLCLVTNQSGVARGLFTEETLHRIHARLVALLAAEGAALDSIAYCPHHPTAGAPPYRAVCRCRKPLPGLYEDAVLRFGIDATRSFAVGDTLRDLEAGAALGAQGVLVRTGKGRDQEQRAIASGRPTIVVDDLAAAADWILSADHGAQADATDTTT